MNFISDYIDLGWLAIFGPSLYAHIYSYCIIGICQDHQTNYVSSFESTLFVFSVCLLLAEWNLWPKSLKRPPKTLFYVYTALASMFVTNIAVQLVWLPLLGLQTMINKELSLWLATISMCLGFGKKSKLYKWAEWLATAPGLAFGSRIWSILMFMWVLDATNKFTVTWNFIQRMFKPFATVVCSEFNQKPRGSRRGGRRRPNLCEYVDDFQSPTNSDPPEAQDGPYEQPNLNIPWDEDTD